MKLEPILINVILFTFIAVTMGYFVYEINTTYQTGANSTSQREWDQFEEGFDDIADSMDAVSNSTVGFYKKPNWDPTKYTDMLAAFVGVGVVLLQTPDLLSRYMSYITGMLGIYIPANFFLAIEVIILIIFVMRVMSIFVKPGDDV